MANDPQRQSKAYDASANCNEVCRAVTVNALFAGTFAFGVDDAVLVEDNAVENIEDITREDGGHGHESPVL